MASTVVVIVFHSPSGATETLAMSAAVGAVQGRALIRLRRVADVDPERIAAERPDCGEPLARRQKEYVAPTESDVLGADALVIVPPPGAAPTSAEWQPFVTLVERLGAGGKLAGKVGAIVHTGDAQTVLAFSMTLLAPGLVIVPTADPGPTPDRLGQATAHGRRAADLARTLKSAIGGP